MDDFALRSGPFPERLYRYRGFDANEIRLLLTAGQIRFADPTRFNDPWDCLPRIENKRRPTTDGEWKGVQERYLEIVAETIPHDSPKYAEIMAIFSRDDCRELARKRLEGSFIEPVDQVRSFIRVLCLSERGEAPLMWSHYAQGHTGLCLVFSTLPVSPFSNALEVKYPDEYPSAKYPLLMDLVARGLLCKPSYWRYEREYRIFAHEPEMAWVAGWEWGVFARCVAGFVPVPSWSLVGVILGARMTTDHAAQTLKLLSSADHSIEIWRAHIEEHRYDVRLEFESRTRGK